MVYCQSQQKMKKLIGRREKKKTEFFIKIWKKA